MTLTLGHIYFMAVVILSFIVWQFWRRYRETDKAEKPKFLVIVLATFLVGVGLFQGIRAFDLNDKLFPGYEDARRITPEEGQQALEDLLK